MRTIIKRVGPMFDPAHPGRILRAYTEERGVADLASAIGLTRQTLYRILAGKASITAPVALRLQKAGCNDADFWMRLQIQYDLAQARMAERNLRKAA